jgi:crossover junction endodeoxyribonuclease RuvC
MTTIYLGIDPGFSGACAAFLPDHALAGDLCDEKIKDPILRVAQQTWALQEMIDACRQYDVELVALVEQVGGRPTDGSNIAFKFGMSYGGILAVLHANNIPVRTVTPAKWKADLFGATYFKGMSGTQTKEESRLKALTMFPQAAEYLARKKDHGRAEALLLAYYGQQKGL